MTHPSKAPTPEMIAAGNAAFDAFMCRGRTTDEDELVEQIYLAMQSTQPEAALMVTDEVVERLRVCIRRTGAIESGHGVLLTLCRTDDLEVALAALTNQETGR